MILEDLRALRPFQQVEGRSFDSFNDISHDSIHTLDKEQISKMDCQAQKKICWFITQCWKMMRIQMKRVQMKINCYSPTCHMHGTIIAFLP